MSFLKGLLKTFVVELVWNTNPSEVDVAEAVDELEMLTTNSRNAAHDLFVGQLVVECVHIGRHVTRVIGAVVEVALVFGHEIDVVEYET